MGDESSVNSYYEKNETKIRYYLMNRLERQIQKSYWDGYSFHRNAVNDDCVLYEWVRKNNYLHSQSELSTRFLLLPGL